MKAPNPVTSVDLDDVKVTSASPYLRNFHLFRKIEETLPSSGCWYLWKWTYHMESFEWEDFEANPQPYPVSKMREVSGNMQLFAFPKG